MRQKNFVLEQTLSSENKLKQDLFRALNDSKAEIASLKGLHKVKTLTIYFPSLARLHCKQSQEQNEVLSAFRDNGTTNSLFHGNSGGSGSSGSSPTVHQQQFPLSQQKSLTPPPLSVGSSTFNSTLEQLLQATQNMYEAGALML